MLKTQASDACVIVQDSGVSRECVNVLMHAQALLWLKHTQREITPSYKTVRFSIISDNCLPQTRGQNPPDKFPLGGY